MVVHHGERDELDPAELGRLPRELRKAIFRRRFPEKELFVAGAGNEVIVRRSLANALDSCRPCHLLTLRLQFPNAHGHAAMRSAIWNGPCRASPRTLCTAFRRSAGQPALARRGVCGSADQHPRHDDQGLLAFQPADHLRFPLVSVRRRCSIPRNGRIIA